MPTIATCRKCHAGAVAEPRKVVSNCMLCHDFHDRAHARGVPPGERTVLAQ
jgi:hypothetical protein